MTPDEFLGRDGATFAFGAHLHGAFGGVFGGVLAAAAVRAARDVAAGRVPASLDCRFLRALPAGRARAVVTVLHAGRSMTTVAVDLVDGRERVATHATMTLVETGGLAAMMLHPGPGAATGTTGGTPWRNPPGVEAPIIDTLEPRTIALPHAATTTIATAIDVPWDDPNGTATAEAVCLAADLCVGPPVAVACRGRRVAHPNPDVSLRVATAPVPPGEAIVATGRLAALDAGLATVAIDVAAAGRTVGVGASFSVLLEAP